MLANKRTIDGHAIQVSFLLLYYMTLSFCITRLACARLVNVLFQMKMSQAPASVNIQEFAFKPKERLPTVSRYSHLRWHLRPWFRSANKSQARPLHFRFLMWKLQKRKTNFQLNLMLNYIKVLFYLTKVQRVWLRSFSETAHWNCGSDRRQHCWAIPFSGRHRQW